MLRSRVRVRRLSAHLVMGVQSHAAPSGEARRSYRHRKLTWQQCVYLRILPMAFQRCTAICTGLLHHNVRVPASI